MLTQILDLEVSSRPRMIPFRGAITMRCEQVHNRHGPVGYRKLAPATRRMDTPRLHETGLRLDGCSVGRGFVDPLQDPKSFKSLEHPGNRVRSARTRPLGGAQHLMQPEQLLHL
jgi:hypothetical protein